MPRKLFKQRQLRRLAAVGALVLAAGTAHAQEAVAAGMWAATARYVYADDPNLKPLVAKLNAELGQPQTLGEFEQKLSAAATEAAAASKTPNIKVLQRQFQNMRSQNAAELSMSLADSLGKMPARGQGERKQKLSALEKQLLAMAQSKSEAGAAAPAAPEAAAAGPAVAATSSLPQPAAPATSPLLWAALAMSGLSLLGVIRLLTRRRSRHSSAASGSLEMHSGSQSTSLNQPLSPEQHREVSSMIAKALASRSEKPAAPALSAGPAATAPAPVRQAPAPNVKQKLVSNSPKPVRPPIEPSSAPLPSLASVAGAEPVPSSPVTPAAAPAEPTPVPAAVEPGTSVELDVTPAAAPPEPAPRLQFVNEAPFNNTFAARTLSDTLAPYSIYEVLGREQTPDQAQFRVVGNMVSHISNHRNILEPVCEYVAYPQGGETRIITEQPGEVRRRGADWEIVRRARIRFE